jgi:hypothetical protein
MEELKRLLRARVIVTFGCFILLYFKPEIASEVTFMVVALHATNAVEAWRQKDGKS